MQIRVDGFLYALLSRVDRFVSQEPIKEKKRRRGRNSEKDSEGGEKERRREGRRGEERREEIIPLRFFITERIAQTTSS